MVQIFLFFEQQEECRYLEGISNIQKMGTCLLWFFSKKDLRRHDPIFSILYPSHPQGHLTWTRIESPFLLLQWQWPRGDTRYTIIGFRCGCLLASCLLLESFVLNIMFHKSMTYIWWFMLKDAWLSTKTKERHMILFH